MNEWTRWVRYEINGQTYDAGPYNMNEIFSQRRDIASYEGVENVRIINEEERTPIESFLVRECQ